MAKQRRQTQMERMREAEGTELAQSVGFWTAHGTLAAVRGDRDAYEYANAGAVRALAAQWAPEPPPLRHDGRSFEPWSDVHG